MVSILVIIYVVFISLGLPDSVFGVAWPVVHNEFGVHESFASLYSIITGVCSGGSSFLAGVVLRKFGTPKVTFVSILMTAAGLVGISFAPNIWVMMCCTVVLSYGAGAIDTGLNNYVSLHFKARHMSWLHAFWGIGVTLSPIIMSAFLGGEYGNWRNGYRVIALIQLCIALGVAVMLPKWTKHDTIKRTAEAGEEEKEKVNIFAFRGLIPSIAALGFYCSMEFTVGTWGASYIVNVYSLGADVAARWISVYFCGIMLGRIISGFVSDKLGDDKMIRLGILVSAFGMLIILLPFGSISLIGFILIGMGFGPIFPSVLHAVPSRFGIKYSADITGFHMGGAYATGFVSQLLFGYAATGITFKIFPFVLIAFLILLFVLNETAVKKTSSKIQG
ncbi:MAG: MFS transporter [Ruminococcaceae bacterium]|nr:MFS transporter [Oscillospiraceae bacterium]